VLQVILIKTEKDAWTELYVGGPMEEHQPIIENLNEEPVKILEAELEECDFGLAGMEADYNIGKFHILFSKICKISQTSFNICQNLNFWSKLASIFIVEKVFTKIKSHQRI
jgi:hypothetical protein